MGKLADLVVGIRGDTKQFDDSIRKSEKTLLAFGKSATKIGKQLTLFVTLPILGIGAAFAKVAADAEETNSKFDAVFKGQAEAVREWTKEYSQATGRSTIENIKFLASVQDLFVPLGVARDDAVDLSKSVVTLATDMASFNNQPTERVLLDIQSALVGSVITMRKYGVVLNETNLNQELLNMGIEGGNRAATAGEKALARLNIIMAASVDAQGDAIRTAGSITNRFIALKSSVIDLSESFGNVMIPALQELVTVVIKAVRFVNDLDESKKKLIITVAGLAAAVGPLLFVVGQLIALFAIASGPAGWITLAVIAIVALTIAIWEMNAASREEKKLDGEIIALKDLLTKTRGDERVAILESIAAKQREKIVTIEVAKAEIEERITSLAVVLGQRDAESAFREEIGRTNDKLKEAKAAFAELNAELLIAVREQREEIRQRRLLIPIIEEQTEKVEEEKIALQEWVEEEVEAIRLTGTLSNSILGLNDIVGTYVGLVADGATELVGLNEVTKEHNIALEEQLSLFEILNITAAESYRIQVEGAAAAAAAARKLERVQEQVNAAILSTTKTVVSSMGAIWGNYYAGILMDENLTDEERKKIMRKQAIAAKSFALFDIAINTAVAISKALPNFVLALLAGISGAAQAAVVVSQPIPALAEGGIVSQPTLALIGEKGPERITPLDEEPIHVTVMLGSKVLYDDISRASRDRKILIDGRAVV